MRKYTLGILLLVIAIPIGVAAQTPTPTITPEPILGIQLAIPELEPYEHEQEYASPLSGVTLGFEQIWISVRSGYTVYDIVADVGAWPVLVGLLLISVAISILFRVMLKPPEF